jgi:hypothetical protein
MSLAYFIVPEQDVPGLDCFVDGKALARFPEGLLNRLCAEAGARPLSEFVSQNPEESAAFFEGEGIDPPPGGFPAEQWFAAAEGLRTVRALLAQPDRLKQGLGSHWTLDAVLGDLQDYERVLIGLERAGVRWHLAVDF